MIKSEDLEEWKEYRNTCICEVCEKRDINEIVLFIF